MYKHDGRPTQVLRVPHPSASFALEPALSKVEGVGILISLAKRQPQAYSRRRSFDFRIRPAFRSSLLVRRAHVGEFREKVFMGSDLILRHLSIC